MNVHQIARMFREAARQIEDGELRTYAIVLIESDMTAQAVSTFDTGPGAFQLMGALEATKMDVRVRAAQSHAAEAKIAKPTVDAIRDIGKTKQ